MAVGEIYIKLAVAFPDDPKVRALARYGTDAGLARDLYVQMTLYCKRLLSDGFVPDEQLGLLVYPLDPEHGKQLAKQLASVGLINEQAGGWNVLAYLKRNGSREDVERLSEVRAEAGRRGGKVSRRTARQSGGQAKSKHVASGALKQNEARDRDISTELPYGSSGAQAHPPHAGDVVASYVDGARAGRQPDPASSLRARIGREAGKLLSEHTPPEVLLQAAFNAGASGWHDLAVQIQRDAAAVNGNGPGQSTGAERAQAAIAAGQRVQAMIDGRTDSP
jgi:hypothetical protein